MNRKVLKTLEYGKIKQKIARFLTTKMGLTDLERLVPIDNQSRIQQWLDETDDGFHLYRIKDGLPVPNLDDVRVNLKRLEIGAALDGKELAKVSQILTATDSEVNFFDHLRKSGVHFNRLYSIVDSFANLSAVSQLLRRSIGEDGKLLDGASSRLYGLRKRLTRIDSQVKAKMNRYVTGRNTKYLNNSTVTIRDGRYVIPIKAAAKQRFGGIVHDQSTSGETLFVEPKGAVSLNNYYQRTRLSERQEERRLLVELSKTLRPYQKEIGRDVAIWGRLDVINAKAHYAYLTKSTKPMIDWHNVVKLKQARHPLIDPAKVVANDIFLGRRHRAMIITGPNTGGKTITLKTLGLLQLMGQSGMFIPARDGSQIGVFDDIFADIGDEQSIEQSLSTFSSHMDNIIRILRRITPHSLILLDEVGAGTDPSEGAALAISILDAIGRVNSEVVATTHYPALKTYGYNHSGTINASMEFNPKTLKPTYHLLMGIPGQSNGLNIARRLGLDRSIVAEARSLTSRRSQNINRMITQLARQARYARQDAHRLWHELRAATKLHHELASVFSGYQKYQRHLNLAAKERANRLVTETKKRANRIIKDLHRKQKQVANSPVKENELMNDKGRLNSLQQNISLKHNHILKRAKQKRAFHSGDDVYVKPYGERGVLIDQLNRHHWKVQIGILKMDIADGDLKRIAPVKEPSHSYTMVSRTASSGLSPKLDLRGMRYSAAMHKLDRYIDAALLAGYSEVTIIHGKGTGALRKGVNAYLKRNRRVTSYHYSPANAGGDGSTIAKLG